MDRRPRRQDLPRDNPGHYWLAAGGIALAGLLKWTGAVAVFALLCAAVFLTPAWRER